MDMARSKVESQIERAGFQISFETDAGLADQSVDVDADAFTQIVINLVDNALKFSQPADTKVIEVAAHLHQEQVMFSVRDYGPGVPRKQMKKIFKLFYRLENELTRETVGTGIGLALVHQLCRAMGGSVDVVNRRPGAEFRVFFPRQKPE
jgi:signal transduction histidine kinase